MKPLRICLDARLPDGICGGVQQVIIGLASALSTFEKGSEEYHFLTSPGDEGWLKPYVYGPCKLLPGPVLHWEGPIWKRWLNRKVPVVRAAWHRLQDYSRYRSFHVPSSDGTIERAGISVMHFTTQGGFLTPIPSIYQPHDLQHLHLPEMFRPRQRLVRETLYRTLCDQAEMVVAMTKWGRDDLLTQYCLPAEKVCIVPWAPVLSAYTPPTQQDLENTRAKFSLPEQFLFYPAQVWGHKNHLGLLAAVNLLQKSHGLTIPLVCSGRKDVWYARVEEVVRQYGLERQVEFLGFVGTTELQCLYKLCRAMVFPSRFEGWGMPVTEAFASGAPVACSNVTSLPDLAGDAALLFNPDDPVEIANAVARLWQDEGLRRSLVIRGFEKVKRFSWLHTAKLFRAHYRRIGKRPLDDEDHVLLEAEPLL